MSKSDFQFYKFPGIDREFVVPAPACDPYKAQFSPVDIPDLAAEVLGQEVESVMGNEPQIEVVAGCDGIQNPDSNFLRRRPGFKNILWQQLNVTVPMPEEPASPYFSQATGRLAQIIAGRRTIDLLTGQPITPAGLAAQHPVLRRSQSMFEDTAKFTDDDELPMHPFIRLTQKVDLRTYEWLPGNVRLTQTGDELPPNYSPRPTGLVIAQIVSIQALNPQVAEAIAA